MPEMINLQPQDMQGILDRLKNGRELLKLLNSGLVSEVLSIISHIPAGKYGEALVDVADILAIEGLPAESSAVRALGHAMTPRPFVWKDIIPPAFDLAELLLLRVVPSDPPVMQARIDITRAPRGDCQRWLADNAANVREGRDRRGVRFALRHCPEVLDALDGKPQTMGMTPERAEQIINALDWAIAISTVAGMFFPAALAVSTALRAIQVYLKSKYPEINALPDFTPDGVDRGLALDDFVVLA